MADYFEQYVRSVLPSAVRGDLFNSPGQQVDVLEKGEELRFQQVWIPRQRIENQEMTIVDQNLPVRWPEGSKSQRTPFGNRDRFQRIPNLPLR